MTGPSRHATPDPALARTLTPPPMPAALGFRQVEVEVLPDQTLKRPDAAVFSACGRRRCRAGPPAASARRIFRLGKFVFYRLADLQAFKARHSVERLPKQPDLI